MCIQRPHQILSSFPNICMTYNYLRVSQEHLKMRIFLVELKDKMKECLKSVGYELISWSEMEKCFLRKFYSFGKPNSLSRGIREFILGTDNFSEAWERFLTFTKRFTHHGIPSCELVPTFYGVSTTINKIW